MYDYFLTQLKLAANMLVFKNQQRKPVGGVEVWHDYIGM